jgi:hypothetical protein
MSQQEIKLQTYKAKYPSSFDPNRLDNKLSNVQLWDGGTMLTANLPILDAKMGIGTSYYVISDQAVGTIRSLLE